MSDSQSVPPYPETGVQCDESWREFNGSCYLVTKGNGITWNEAQNRCMNLSADLVSITGLEENMFVLELALSAYADPPCWTPFWIGARDYIGNNNFIWLDGTCFNYTNWYPSEPNDSQERCLEILINTPDGTWNDNLCDSLNLGFVCERSLTQYHQQCRIPTSTPDSMPTPTPDSIPTSTPDSIPTSTQVSMATQTTSDSIPTSDAMPTSTPDLTSFVSVETPVESKTTIRNDLTTDKETRTMPLPSYELSWSVWTSWTECPPCGQTYQMRLKLCETHHNCTFNTARDDGTIVYYDISWQPCDDTHCPMDGAWTMWSAWSDCSYTCGGGTQIRSRECIGPYNGGLPCVGDTTEVDMCNMHSCPEDDIESTGASAILRRREELLPYQQYTEADHESSNISIGVLGLVLVVVIFGLLLALDGVSLMKYCSQKRVKNQNQISTK